MGSPVSNNSKQTPMNLMLDDIQPYVKMADRRRDWCKNGRSRSKTGRPGVNFRKGGGPNVMVCKNGRHGGQV